MIINPYIFGGGAPAAFTAALLHFDGANGATTFTDEVSANSWARLSASALSTAQQKFGASSMSCPSSTTSGILASYNPNFDLLAAAAFTVEAFVYLTAAGDKRIFSLGGTVTAYNTTTGMHLLMGINSAGSWSMALNDTSGSGLTINGPTGEVTTGVWHHVALCVDASSARNYVDGTLRASASSATIRRPTGNPVPCIGRINSQGGGNDWQGYVDEFRITKGAALYTGSTYTVPTAAFAYP